MNETFLVDTHSHINTLEKITPQEAIDNAKANGVEKIIVPAAAVNDVDEVLTSS